jgi:hypothetical protein
MLFTLFCCFSTGLVVYCVLNRVHRRSLEIAVRLAVRDAEKDFESRNMNMLTQLAGKEAELTKVRDRLKLHEAVPGVPQRAPAAVTPLKAKPGGAPPAQLPAKKLKQDPLNVFEMSRPFTDTSYDALLATSDVVKVEGKGM